MATTIITVEFAKLPTRIKLVITVVVATIAPKIVVVIIKLILRILMEPANS